MSKLKRTDPEYRLPPRRLIVFPRRYRQREQIHPLWDDEDDTGSHLYGSDHNAKETLYPLPVHTEVASEDLDSKKTHNKYLMKVPLGRELEPDDVSVSMKDHTVTINAKKEKKLEDGSLRLYKEVWRKITLPQNVDMKEAKSFLTPDGAITIEAPVKVIPIKIWKSDFLFPGNWEFRWSKLLLFIIYLFIVYLLFLFFVYTT